VIGVSIVTYQSAWTALEATVRGLAQQTRQVDCLIVHANSASPHEAEQLHRQLAKVCEIPLVFSASPENLGFCGGHNANLERLFADGMTAALVLNPDLILDPDAVAELESALGLAGDRSLLGPLLELADPTTFAATGLIDTAGTRWTRSSRHLDLRQGEPICEIPFDRYQTAAISGACLFVSRGAHDELTARTGEFFDEDFVAYREDAELGLRASLLGIVSWIVPSARGRHVRRLRGTQRGLDPQIDSFSTRNRFLLAFKYGRTRPGNLGATLCRDAMVIAAVVVTERSSLPALREAWRLRRKMRAKRARLEREIAKSHG
jgi:GT2 family glycosyltransferase